MHLWLHEPRNERVSGILAELRSAGLKPVLIEDHVFADGGKAFLHHDEWVHPLLLAATLETVDRIRSLRKAGGRNPIIVYRDLRSPERTIQALEAGADHVAVTPLRGDDLKARFAAIFRRSYGHAGGDLSLGSLKISFSDEDPLVNSTRITLCRIERQILRRLALGVGQPVSRAQIYEAVYGLSEKKPYINVIDRYICNIRRKLAQADPGSETLLKTFPGRGYALAQTDFAKNCEDRGEDG